MLQGSMIGCSDENGSQRDGINEDGCFTLNTTDRHAVAAPEADHYSTSKNSHHTVAAHEQANTLVASDWKAPPLVYDLPNDEPVYIVRRLTLWIAQGFRAFRTGGVLILPTQTLSMKKSLSGLMHGKLGKVSQILMVSRKQRSKSENGWLIRIRTRQSIDYGVTVFHCRLRTLSSPALHGQRRISALMQQIVNRLILSFQKSSGKKATDFLPIYLLNRATLHNIFAVLPYHLSLCIAPSCLRFD